MLIDPAAKRARRHGAAVARQFPAVADKDHRRYGLDVIARCETLLGIRVDLAEAQARLELLCRCLKHRRHRTAWAAPRRPEVHQQRQIRRRCVAVKMGAVEIDRLAGKQRLVALAALAAFAQPAGWYPVQGVTMRTWNG